MRHLLIAVMWLLSCMVSACGSLPGKGSSAPGLRSALIPGNQVKLLFDGPQTMAAMETAIRSAQRSIHLETYIFDQDAVGQHFAQLLMASQRSGVKVRIIYDAVGTLGTPDSFFDTLKASGIELLAFNPVNPFKLRGPWQPNNRDHRKLLVVDDRIAFTGGVNISQSYAKSSLFRSKATKGQTLGWRDTHLQVQGPAVAVLQTVFLRTWNSHATRLGQTATTAGSFSGDAVGQQTVQVVASEAGGLQEVRTAYIEAIRDARYRIYLTCAYLVPDAGFLLTLLEAAQRGVDVQLVLPGVKEGGMVFYAGQSYFDEMLAGGLRIFLMREAVLHAKTAVIDGRWSTVGTANMDTRSFLHNSEVNVIVIDAGFGNTMEAAFTEDRKDSDELFLPQWRERPTVNRMKEWLYRQFAYWL